MNLRLKKSQHNQQNNTWFGLGVWGPVVWDPRANPKFQSLLQGDFFKIQTTNRDPTHQGKPLYSWKSKHEDCNNIAEKNQRHIVFVQSIFKNAKWNVREWSSPGPSAIYFRQVWRPFGHSPFAILEGRWRNAHVYIGLYHGSVSCIHRTWDVYFAIFSSWWLNHPFENMSHNGNLLQIGVKIKNIWNDHLVYVLLSFLFEGQAP